MAKKTVKKTDSQKTPEQKIQLTVTKREIFGKQVKKLRREKILPYTTANIEELIRCDFFLILLPELSFAFQFHGVYAFVCSGLFRLYIWLT